MRRTAFLLSILASAAGALPLTAQTAPSTTIIFVRHVEAAGGDPRDPTLSPAGEQRAQSLVKALAGAHIAAVYTSQYQRTRQTGDAVAKAANVIAEVVTVNGASLDADAAALVARIAKDHPGKTVLVVGHSNTVPLMVKKATGVTVDPIAETEFDHMYVVTIENGTGRVIQARY